MLCSVGKEDNLKKTRNDLTGVIHGLSGRKVGLLQLYETICGISTGLVWLKAERYVTNNLSQFPMTVVSKALGIVMKERKFKVKFDIKYHLDYIT